jgi:hypothetical protein
VRRNERLNKGSKMCAALVSVSSSGLLHLLHVPMKQLCQGYNPLFSFYNSRDVCGFVFASS